VRHWFENNGERFFREGGDMRFAFVANHRRIWLVSWLWISSGEISVEEKLKEARLDATSGHEVRLIDIEADSRAYGVFDNLQGAGSRATFAESIQQAVQKNHGVVGAEFVRRLIGSGTVASADDLKKVIQEQVTDWVAKLPSAPNGQISRAPCVREVVRRSTFPLFLRWAG
jgi:hypothetical protein